jgi:hypothetical protein
MAKNKQIRFTIVTDDDCHRYCIPVALVEEFDEWLLDDERSNFEESSKYDRYRMNGRLTFTDPKCE